MKKTGKKSGGIVLPVIILVIGMLLFLYPDFEKWQQKRQADAVLESFASLGETDAEAGETDAVLIELEKAETPSPSPLVEGSGETEAESGDGETAVLDDTVSEQDESGEVIPADDDADSEGEPLLTLLCREMEAYNEDLLSGGQNVMDSWNYEQNPIPLSYMPSGSDAIGRIRIPDMDVEMVLLLGASRKNMATGAVVLAETSMPIGGIGTNCVIAGHRGYHGMPYFRNIQDLYIGSRVYIDNPWETLEYVVVGTSVIFPDDLSCLAIQRDKDMVTLITCHPYMGHGKYRYVVYCERVTDEVLTEVTAIEESGAAQGTASGETAVIPAESVIIPTENGIDETEIVSENRFSSIMVQAEIWLRYILAAAFVIWWTILLIERLRENRKEENTPDR